MQRIILDTNVIVSSLIQRSYPHRILYDLFVEDKFVLCVSEELVREYFAVLSRPKFSRFPDFFGKAESLLTYIESKALKFNPAAKIDILQDKSDNMILELAEECKADFIITGNTNDFTISEYKQTKIVTPKQYWELYAPE